MSKTKEPVDLSITHLPAIRERARAIMAEVASGTHPFKLGGQTILSTHSTIISVPVGMRYRLLFNAKTLEPYDFMTHEDYNKVLKRKAK